MSEEDTAAAGQGQKEQEAVGTPVEKETLTEADGAVRENKSVYVQDDETSVVTMYLTVQEGNAADNTNHTWSEINQYSTYYYEDNDLERYNCEALLQVGDESGPLEGELGYGETIPNAAVQIRGQTSSRREQKNYKIRIKDGRGEWRGQRTIALNKHIGDPVRFRNKLAYDLIKEIPQMIGARTQFVHLYVKDNTAGGSGEFEDYGLFTQVEQMNKTYLKNHGLDSKGHLYKVNFFEWYEYDALMLKTDAGYDEKAFEEYLEIKGDDDHTKLLETIREINDYSIPIEEIVEKHFDMENMCYWIAFQILIGNYDVSSRNYYIYSPLNSEKWYFISWDNDSILKEGYEIMDDAGYERSWNKGIFTFADTVLFKRILQDETCRQALGAAVEDLRNSALTEVAIQQKIDVYRDVTEQYLYSLPDQTYTSVSEENYDILAESMAEEVTENYGAYKESMESVWPFHILDPVNESGKTVLSWEAAYVQDSSGVTYTIELSEDYSFEECILNTQTGENRCETEELPEGQYFVRIRAAGSSGNSQDAYEYYRTEWGTTSYSTLCFYVMDDGTVAAVRYSEEE